MKKHSAETLRDLFAGKLPWPMVKEIMSSYKDDARFFAMLDVMQEGVKWKDAILLPVGEHLHIVQKSGTSGAAGRVVKCDCGHEFGDYRNNWKLSAHIRVRDSDESIAEVYPTSHPCNPEWMELREFICPGCATLLEVEAAPPGWPVAFDFLPDLEAFYRDWLGRPLPE